MKRHYAYAFLLVVLSACATLNVPAPTTFNQKATVGYQSVDTVVQTTTTLLKSGKISAKDAQNVHDGAVNARDGIDIARSVHETNPGAGDEKLTAAITGLTALQQYLAKRK